MFDVLALFTVFSLLIILLFLTHKAAKMFQLSAENSRKAVHILMGLTVALFPFIFEHKVTVWALALLSLTLFYSIRHYKNIHASLGDALYRIERRSYGEVYYTLAVALTFNFAPNLSIYILTIFILTFADAFASLFGIRYGKYLISFRGNNKSLEGSFSFLLTTFILALLFTQNLFFALTLSLALTLIELISTRGIDNLLIPLFSLLIFKYFESSETLTLLIFSSVTLILLALIFRYFHTFKIYKHKESVELRYKKELLSSCQLYEKNYFGDLFAKDASALESLLKVLKKSHHELIGPINGSTWKKYRVVTYSDGREPFLLEPTNPTFYPEVFEKHNFKIDEGYYSSIVELHSAKDSRMERVKKRLHEHGIEIRNIDLDNFEHELKSLYTLSCEAFKENPYYSDISEEEFLALYMPYQKIIPAQLAQLVFLDDELIGYMFALIDNQNLILKTIAFKPLKASAGTGLVILDNMAKFALSLGCTHLIYALMHEDNHSAKTANKNATIFRRYALYKWSEK